MKFNTPLTEILKFANTHTDRKHFEISINVISEVTFQPLEKVISFFLSDYGIKPIFNIGDYDQLGFEAFNLEKIESPNPQYLYVHSSTLKYFAKASGIPNCDVSEKFKEIIDEYLNNIRKIINTAGSAYVVVNLFELPPYRLRGSYSARSGIINIIQYVNNEILILSRENENVLIHDTNFVSASLGLDNWFDFNSWAAFKQPLTAEALKRFGASFASVLAASVGRSKKLLIADFDNTLWGGVVGDDGHDGILLGSSSPKGELFTLMQSYIKQLAASGIALGACSKNQIENVKDVFQRRESLLSLNDFSVAKINWQPKSENIKSILNELNLGSDSAVFIDDNPFEISEVSRSIPDCHCVTYDKSVIDIIRAIDYFGLFETQKLSNDDLGRNKSYIENVRRSEAKESFDDYDEFLASLGMKSTVFWNNTSDAHRLVSLVSKTNQFNTNQIKLSESKLNSYLSSPSNFVLSADLSDKFGYSGIVSVMFGSFAASEMVIENWVMSCRVFKRGLEGVLLEALVTKAKKLGVELIKSSIVYSPKNSYCRTVYKSFGFHEQKVDDSGVQNVLFLKSKEGSEGNKSGSSICVTFS